MALQPITVEPLLRHDFEVIDRDGFDIRLELANVAVQNFGEMQAWLPGRTPNEWVAAIRGRGGRFIGDTTESHLLCKLFQIQLVIHEIPTRRSEAVIIATEEQVDASIHPYLRKPLIYSSSYVTKEDGDDIELTLQLLTGQPKTLNMKREHIKFDNVNTITDENGSLQWKPKQYGTDFNRPDGNPTLSVMKIGAHYEIFVPDVDGIAFDSATHPSWRPYARRDWAEVEQHWGHAIVTPELTVWPNKETCRKNYLDTFIRSAGKKHGMDLRNVNYYISETIPVDPSVSEPMPTHVDSYVKKVKDALESYVRSACDKHGLNMNIANGISKTITLEPGVSEDMPTQVDLYVKKAKDSWDRNLHKFNARAQPALTRSASQNEVAHLPARWPVINLDALAPKAKGARHRSSPTNVRCSSSEFFTARVHTMPASRNLSDPHFAPQPTLVC